MEASAIEVEWPVLSYTSDDSYVGGTGEFKRAAGSQELVVHHDFDSGVMTIEVHGTVELAD